jgi:RHS repeat-associated protein
VEWSPQGEPERVQVHDFADRKLGEYAKAIPYGIYDVSNNEGWVSVGDVADTATFAVESIRRWWNQMGRIRFPDADRLLITADAGGSNGYRLRAWKVDLARLAQETGLRITVCHYAPGTSKWNTIEHRMFSFITMNWRGKPLTSLRTIIELISATSTQTGLSIQADYDPNWYAAGLKVTNKELAAVPLEPHDFHGEWNYTISAQSISACALNRYYDPSTDQFITVDPAVMQTGQTNAYDRGDPLNQTDPLGLYKSSSYIVERYRRGDQHINLVCGTRNGPGQTGYGGQPYSRGQRAFWRGSEQVSAVRDRCDDRTGRPNRSSRCDCRVRKDIPCDFELHQPSRTRGLYDSSGCRRSTRKCYDRLHRRSSFCRGAHGTSRLTLRRSQPVIAPNLAK